MRRNAYGFEIDRKFYQQAKTLMLDEQTMNQRSVFDIFIEDRKQEQMRLAGVVL